MTDALKRIALAHIELGEAILASIDGPAGTLPATQPVVAATAPAQTVVAGSGDKCPVHGREWRSGKFGLYCSAKALPGQSQNQNGYCNLTPAK